MLKAYGDKLIVRPETEPGYETRELQRGIVVAVGEGYWSGGMKVKLKVGEGDVVWYIGGSPFEFAGNTFVGITCFDLFAGATLEGLEHEQRS